MTEINYHDKLREKIMEDKECKKDLMEVRMWTKIKYYDEIEDENIWAIVLENLNWNIVNTDAGTFSIHRIKEILWNDLAINHIIHFLKNKEICSEFWEWKICIFWEKEYKRINIDFLKNLNK